MVGRNLEFNWRCLWLIFLNILSFKNGWDFKFGDNDRKFKSDFSIGYLGIMWLGGWWVI